ncbi:hypothetical protein [Cellulomonas xiejunii]|uniref:hypothetical protein n=1 Tax=Cellulomonas xiejunii TaxID=2968083 RepID=UPI001D0EF1D8|nr:hypothetical protein [Cellulomonas xiejunii]MCC2314197.1 hypothetical protein [Cellulomonas xiejunii]
MAQNASSLVTSTVWGPPSRLGLIAVVSLTAVIVAACADSEPAADPALVWVDGEPTGPLESDPWVRAVRAAELAFARASNVADFSRPDLVDSWTYFRIGGFVNRAEGELLHGTPRVYPGPRPLAPVAVRVADDGKSAKVAACVSQRETLPAENDGNRWPNDAIYTVELMVDGHRRVRDAGPPLEPFLLADGTELTAEYCDTVHIPRAVFDPAPDLAALAEKDRDDVVPPPSPSPSATS